MPVEETEENIRYRVKPPDYFHKESFRTIDLGDNIKAVIGCPKGTAYSEGKCKNGTQIQTLLFKKPEWNRGRVEKWVKKHPKIKAKKKKK